MVQGSLDAYSATELPFRLAREQRITLSPPPARRSFDVTAIFGGVGGLELGLARSGHHASSFCEIDPEAATILRARFPDAALTRDVRRTEEVAAAIPGGSQLLTAGFPCTDLSQAGRVRGFAGGSSSLVRDAIRLLEQRPFPHVLLENVPNWRLLHRGVYIAEVVNELERLGYRWAYRTVDALAFGAPQRRLRIFFYATQEGDPRDVLFPGDVPPREETYGLDARAHGFYWTEGTRGIGWGEDCTPTLKGGSTVGVPSPPAILLPNRHPVAAHTAFGHHRLITPDIRDAERLQGFPPQWTAEVHSIDGRPFRDRCRWVLVGNAVNVRAAAWLGERLACPTKWQDQDPAPMIEGAPWPAAAWGSAGRRYVASVGTWPINAAREPLADFLQHPGVPLSVRATSGFLRRLLNVRLRVPAGFIEALQAHLAKMEQCQAEAPSNAA